MQLVNYHREGSEIELVTYGKTSNRTSEHHINLNVQSRKVPHPREEVTPIQRTRRDLITESRQLLITERRYLQNTITENNIARNQSSFVSSFSDHGPKASWDCRMITLPEWDNF